MKNHNKLFRTAIRSALAGAMLLASAPAQACNGESPTLASICTTAANFCPRGTLPADGRLLPIASYQALYSLMGNTYGGDGRSTFGLPDLRGRSPIGTGQGPGLSPVAWGQLRGNEMTTLDATNLSQHGHAQADGAVVQTPVLAGPGGGGVTFSNMPPQLGITYCVVSEGLYPSRW